MGSIPIRPTKVNMSTILRQLIVFGFIIHRYGISFDLSVNNSNRDFTVLADVDKLRKIAIVLEERDRELDQLIDHERFGT